MNQLGNRLRELREQKGLSQRELGDLLGVTAAAVGHVEKHRRRASIDYAMRAAHIFGVTVDELLAADEPALPARELA